MSDSLGTARGKVEIDTSQAEQAPAKMAGVAQGISRAMNQVNSSSGKAQSGLSALTSVARQLTAVFGISWGLQGVVQLGKMALAADATATAYRRQNIAALGLAGSQQKLNELLETYSKATGGAVDQAQSLADVVKLQAIGFADSAAELDEFARAARGISVAMGLQQDYVVSQLTLAISNQSCMRLDQLGLDADEARKRIDELKAANASLTDSMAYQQAILEQAKTKFGALADTAITGAERAAISWSNLGLAAGQAMGPGISLAMDIVAAKIIYETNQLKLLISMWEEVGRVAGNFNTGGGTSGEARAGGPALNNAAQMNSIRQQIADDQAQVDALKQSLTELQAINTVDVSPAIQQTKNLIDDLTHSIENLKDQLSNTTVGTAPWGTRGAPNMGPAAALHTESAEIRATKLDWSRGITELNQRTNEELLQQNSDYQRQRADSERQFQTSTLRAAEDFARQRQREEQDLAESIARLHTDAARREARLAEDLGRNIGEAQANSEEKIADLRKDANERLVELDEDYEKDRLKRAHDLSDKLLDAASNLDAKQVYELQRDAAKQEEEAKEAHDDQREKAQEQLDERIEDERKSLAKSISQQQDAYTRQLQDARDADAQRETDMQNDFDKRTEQENSDYNTRMNRMREDHDAQLGEMDRAQGERITQIQNHAQAERDQLDDEHERALDELQNHNSKWHDEIVRADNAALEEFKRLTNPVRVWLKDPTRPLVTPDMAGTSSVAGLPGSSFAGSTSYNNSAFTIAPGAVVVNGTNLNAAQLESAIVNALAKVLEEHTP